jgi:thiamine-phosphate pyrophosphorylase
MALKPQSHLQRKLCAAERHGQRQRPSLIPKAWFLTDPARIKDPVATVSALPSGWGVIYRHFGESNRTSIAYKLSDISRRNGLIFLVAADVVLAKTVGADGVHWPNKRLSETNRNAHAFRLTTSSAHSPVELNRAVAAGIDAALYSTVFTSESPSAQKPIGPARFRQIAKHCPLTLIGLGGITASNAAQIAPHGFASISGIERAFGPRI